MSLTGRKKALEAQEEKLRQQKEEEERRAAEMEARQRDRMTAAGEGKPGAGDAPSAADSAAAGDAQGAPAAQGAAELGSDSQLASGGGDAAPAGEIVTSFDKINLAGGGPAGTSSEEGDAAGADAGAEPEAAETEETEEERAQKIAEQWIPKTSGHSEHEDTPTLQEKEQPAGDSGATAEDDPHPDFWSSEGEPEESVDDAEGLAGNGETDGLRGRSLRASKWLKFSGEGSAAASLLCFSSTNPVEVNILSLACHGVSSIVCSFPVWGWLASAKHRLQDAYHGMRTRDTAGIGARCGARAAQHQDC